MAVEQDDEKDGLDVDLKSLSPEGLVELIQQLEGSRHPGLRKRAQRGRGRASRPSRIAQEVSR
ncbi:MAG: hypothetical protein HY349_07690 [Nitrospirae bacterium]|nr:hypothetical protein [Nitrospirota bacterium]